MDAHTEPEPPDLALQLPRDVYYQLIHTLRGTIAPVSDTPEDRAHRDNAAIALVASMLPANADEANLAASYVALQARGLRFLGLAEQYFTTDHAFAMKCDIQGNKMLREARATRTLLQRIQTDRRKREGDSAAVDQAAWIEHCAIGLMAQALTEAPPAATAAPVQDQATPQPQPTATPPATASAPPASAPRADSRPNASPPSSRAPASSGAHATDPPMAQRPRQSEVLEAAD